MSRRKHRRSIAFLDGVSRLGFYGDLAPISGYRFRQSGSDADILRRDFHRVCGDTNRALGEVSRSAGTALPREG